MQAIVIDDSRAMRGIIKRALVGMGFECFEAADGREAIAKLAEHGRAPTLAMVDWNMPNMNGLEFIKAVRADRAYDEMRIVMVTTEVEMHQVQAALEAGATEYLMKPFTEDALVDKIRLLELDQLKAAS